MILILGGYGTFGSRIAAGLCELGHSVLINGRNANKAEALIQNITKHQSDAQIDAAIFDVHRDLSKALARHTPQVVIHTCGPFQGQDLSVAKTLLQAGVHSIDLSDSRNYVKKVLELDDLGQRNGTCLITGASTVPTLSSAVLVDWEKRFSIRTFNNLEIGITPGQQTDRGEATVKAVLSYLGRRLPPPTGLSTAKPVARWGWQCLHRERYPGLGWRLMGACEAPDLDCLGQRFEIEQLQFSAGMESRLLHLLMWLTSWLVRLGVPVNLPKHSRHLMQMARWFDPLGSGNGGMHVRATATDHAGSPIDLAWHLEALNHDGPHIPATPAIILADRLLKLPTDWTVAPGVRASVGLISLSDYMIALDDLAIGCTETIA